MAEHEEANGQAAQGEQDQTAVTAAPGRHRGRDGHRQRAGRDGADHHQMDGRRPKDNIQSGLGLQQQQRALRRQQGQQHDRDPSPGRVRLAANLAHSARIGSPPERLDSGCASRCHLAEGEALGARPVTEGAASVLWAATPKVWN
jgi:hypothetical protein